MQLVGQPLPGRVVAERDDPFGIVGAVGVEQRVDVGFTALDRRASVPVAGEAADDGAFGGVARIERRQSR
jgi:hypothetical protein